MYKRQRFTFGGEAPMDQRIYYFNTKQRMAMSMSMPARWSTTRKGTGLGVPVDGSTKMPNGHMDAIEPYDYRAFQPLSLIHIS